MRETSKIPAEASGKSEITLHKAGGEGAQARIMWQWVASIGARNASKGRRWWSVFGIGVLLGTTIFAMKTFMQGEVSTMAADAMSGEERLQQLWSERAEISFPVQSRGDVSREQNADWNANSSSNANFSRKRTNAVFNPNNENQKLEERSKASHATIPQYKGALDGVQVRVYLTDKKKIETVPLETYVLGVLAGEMPVDFHLEALKAQAVAARTYIVKRLSSNGVGKNKADVLDTVQHQVYVSKDELDKRWRGNAKRDNLSKLRQAVEETKGLIMTYNGEPIEAAFFSTSNGYTENSEDYWGQEVPYLRSVASPWDKELSPRYEEEVAFRKTRLYRALGISGKAAKAKLSMKVTERTDGKRIKEIEINGKRFSGREIRERLGLASSHFDWKIEGDAIVFTTYGFGHGVGMSQWGANGMARDGGEAADILTHYYTGASLEQASKLPSRTTS